MVVAVGVGAAVAAAGSIASGAMQAGAAGDAADAQGRAIGRAIDNTKSVRDELDNIINGVESKSQGYLDQVRDQTSGAWDRYIKEGGRNDNALQRMLGTGVYGGFTKDGFIKGFKTDKKMQEQGLAAGALKTVDVDPRTGRKIIMQGGKAGINDPTTGKWRALQTGDVKNADGSFTRYGVDTNGKSWSRKFGKDGKALEQRQYHTDVRRTGQFESWADAQEKAGRDAFAADPKRGILTRQFSEKDFHESPGYQYRVSQTEKAINRGATARGLWDSGAAMRELDQNAHDLADQDWNDERNAFTGWQTNTYNMLNGQAQIGRDATDKKAANFWALANGNIGNTWNVGNARGQNSQWEGNSINNLYLGQGQAEADGIRGEAAGWGNAISGATGAVGGALMYGGFKGMNGGTSSSIPNAAIVSSSTAPTYPDYQGPYGPQYQGVANSLLRGVY